MTVDLVERRLLPPLPRAYLSGRDRDLLAPLELLDPDASAPWPELRPPAEPPPGRPELARELAVANRGWGHPRADELAARLADPETLVVATGQQPGLFGGPLYGLSKMVAASLWAEALEAAGRPAVAVFWMATEDHDWDEVANAAFLAPQGLERLSLGDDPDPLLPVGMRTLGPGVSAALARLEELRGGDRFEAWVETLRGIYRPDARFGEAFARLAVDILGARCPLLLDSLSPAVKQAERPWLERLVRKREELDAAYVAADREIADRGYRHQVHPQPGASPLFLLQRAERRRIEWRQGISSGRFALRGGAGSDGGERPVDDLLEILADNPSALSPGVLARPAIQDAILGTALQVLGPGELSYMAQAAPAHRVLGLDAPHCTLRPQALVLESHQRQKLDELGLDLADLLAADDALERRLAELGDRTAARALEAARQTVDDALAGLSEPLLTLDASLERPLEKTADGVRRALTTLDDKVTAAAARSDQVRHQRMEKLRQLVRPGGSLQERVLSTSHWPGKYGAHGFADALFDQLGLDGRRLWVIEP